MITGPTTELEPWDARIHEIHRSLLRPVFAPGGEILLDRRIDIPIRLFLELCQGKLAAGPPVPYCYNAKNHGITRVYLPLTFDRQVIACLSLFYETSRRLFLCVYDKVPTNSDMEQDIEHYRVVQIHGLLGDTGVWTATNGTRLRDSLEIHMDGRVYDKVELAPPGLLPLVAALIARTSALASDPDLEVQSRWTGEGA